MNSEEFNNRLANCWEQLEKKISTDQAFIDAGKGKIKAFENFWFFLNTEKTPGLEINAETKIKVLQKDIIESKTWKIDIENNIFRMTLKNYEYNEFFKKIINLVITKIFLNGYKSEKSINCFLENLAEAKNFFEDEKKISFLSKESQIGLIGELILIKDFFLNKFDYEQSIKNWTGPYKKHDFETKNSLIETKTSSSNNKIVRTSSNDQLSPVFEKRLYLVFVQVSQNLNGKSLNDYVEELSEIFRSKSEILFNDFFLKLTKSGYHLEHADKYKEKYNKNSVNFYVVNPDFPYIGDLISPPEIIELDINYKLDLDLCERFIVKEQEVIL